MGPPIIDQGKAPSQCQCLHWGYLFPEDAVLHQVNNNNKKKKTANSIMGSERASSRPFSSWATPHSLAPRLLILFLFPTPFPMAPEGSSMSLREANVDKAETLLLLHGTRQDVATGGRIGEHFRHQACLAFPLSCMPIIYLAHPHPLPWYHL